MKKIVISIAVVFVYIILNYFNVFFGINLYNDFSKTYSDMSFSKGIVGVLICNIGNVVIFIILTIVLFNILKAIRKK